MLYLALPARGSDLLLPATVQPILRHITPPGCCDFRPTVIGWGVVAHGSGFPVNRIRLKEIQCDMFKIGGPLKEMAKSG